MYKIRCTNTRMKLLVCGQGLNFEKDQSAMKNQLLQLQTLINFVDPELANYLGNRLAH